MQMKISEYAEQRSPYCYDHAKACAKATIERVYHHHECDEGLDDVEIDKLKDALQCLMYIKTLETDKH